MSTFWSGLDDADLVPMPMPDGERPTLGEIRGNNKLEARAQVWAFLKARAQVEMRQTYECAAVHPDMTQDAMISMLSDAAVRIGLAVLDKFQEVEEQRRRSATLARSAALRAKQEQRWGVVRALLKADPTLSAEAMTRTLRRQAEKETVQTGKERKEREPPEDSETSSFGRYVRRVKEELGIR